jgi:hypothetical protein
MQINLVSYGEIIEGLVDEKVYFSSSKSNILNDVNDESQVFLNFNDLLDDPLASVPTILVTQDSNYATYTYDTTSLCVNVKYNSLVPTTYQNEYYPVKIMFITVGFTYNYYFFYLRRSRPPRVEVFATKNIVSLDESTIVTANCKYAASST